LTGRTILTGPPGGGKTPLLGELIARGFTGVPEPAREVLAERRAEVKRDWQLFFDLMLENATGAYAAHDDAYFDRAIPDLIAYAQIFGIDPSPAERAAQQHRYNERVFFLPSWPEIYTTDEDRTMTFDDAHAFGELIRAAYIALNYEILEVPRGTPSERAGFVLADPG
jgi:predicted ATPase